MTAIKAEEDTSQANYKKEEVAEAKPEHVEVMPIGFLPVRI